MAKEFSRTDRLAGQIQRELSQLLRTEIRDPRMGMVTITAVEVVRDLSHAKVYFTSMLDKDKEGSVEALRSASGFLRSEVGKRIRTRIVPQLHFVYDESVEEGARMDRLISDAVASDHESGDEAE